MKRKTAVLAVIVGLLLALSAVASAQPARLEELAAKVTEIEAKVAKLEASDSTNSQAIAEITTRLAEIAQELSRLQTQGDSRADLVRRVDELGLKVNALERELESLRTQLASVEQPEVAPTSGTYYDRGFVLVDGDFSLTLDGYAQTRWFLELPKELDTINDHSFQLVVARLGISGRLGTVLGRKLRYRFLHDLEAGALDVFVDVEIIPEVIIRAGQYRSMYTRHFSVERRWLSFATRPQAIEAFRYDREPGVWAHGQLFDRKVFYHAGFSNGGPRSELNDNVDLLAMARVEGAVLGELAGRHFGDVEHTEEPALTIGASGVHDLVRVPETLAGIVVGNRDVDNDLVFDNVRVVSASADAIFRLKGLELYVEGLLRLERWGTILLHSDNQEIADLIAAGDDGDKTYLGLVGHASYFVWPGRVLVGGRAAYSDQPLLGLGGRQRRVLPPGDRVFELDLLTSYYYDGLPFVSLQYSLINFNNSEGADSPFDVEHRFLIQNQISF